MSYAPIHIHTMYSNLDGFGDPKKNAKRAKELGITSLGISDHGNIAGHMKHIEACKEYKLKPILGIELYVVHKPAYIRSPDNKLNSHIVLWSKNQAGWYELIKLVSQTNDPDYFYYKPRISLFDVVDENGVVRHGLQHFVAGGNLQAFSGHQGSHLSDNLFVDLYNEDQRATRDLIRKAYGQYKDKAAKDPEYYRQFLKPNWFESTCELAVNIEKLFGKGNFFVELQNELNPEDALALWIHPLIVDCLRQVSKATGIPAVASSDPHYPTKEDAKDQKILIYSQLKETEQTVAAKLESSEDMDVMVFFGSESFYIKSNEEMLAKFTPEEVAMSAKIAAQVEEYNISHPPYMPEYDVPKFEIHERYVKNAKTISDKYLMHLCIEGAKKMQPWIKAGKNKEEYWQRLMFETDTIFTAGLSGYFLIVWDYCMAGSNRPADHSFNWKENMAKNGPTDKIPIAPGRGSAAGCLVSYLIGITGIDPLEYDLSFARFYNASRNTKDNIALPDIDIDFSVDGREWIIAYLEHKYGKDNTAQMVTFQRIQGKAAIKDVFRTRGVEGGFDFANEISRFIPQEAEVADELQEMRKSTGANYGLIQWALDNSDEFERICQEHEELTEYIQQAIRIEGTIRGQGRHPSGFIVAPKPTIECFPMIYDTRSKKQIIGMDMNDAAKLGAVKLDLLGTAVLDKLQACEDLVNGKKIKKNHDLVQVEMAANE